MRPLRLTVLLTAALGLLLTGCTDPSPESSGSAETSEAATSSASASTEVTTEASEEESTAAEAEPPVFGTSTTASGSGATACFQDAAEAPLTISTALTAVDTITIEDVTLDPLLSDVEILDAYVLPYDGRGGGLTVGDYPPDDAGQERSDAAGYELEAGETVTVGVGLVSATATPGAMTLGVSYHSGDGPTQTITSRYQLVLAESCSG